MQNGPKPLHAVTSRYMPLQGVTCRYIAVTLPRYWRVRILPAVSGLLTGSEKADGACAKNRLIRRCRIIWFLALLTLLALMPILICYAGVMAYEYTFRVQLLEPRKDENKVGDETGVFRVVRICGDDTLDDLCETAIGAFGFLHEHQYRFIMDNTLPSEDEYVSCAGEDEKDTKELIDELKLHKGQKFLFNYDFGDEWYFRVTTERICKVEFYLPARVIDGEGFVVQYPIDPEDEKEEEKYMEDVDEVR